MKKIMKKNSAFQRNLEEGEIDPMNYSGEKLELILNFANLDLSVVEEKDWNRNFMFIFQKTDTLVSSLSCILRVAVAKSKVSMVLYASYRRQRILV